MNENLRFIRIIDALKEQGQLADYVEAASILGTNKAGISDIKGGRKKLSVEIIQQMKKIYPSVNLNYIIMGIEPMFLSSPELNDLEKQDIFNERILKYNTNTTREGIPLIPIKALAGAFFAGFVRFP